MNLLLQSDDYAMTRAVAKGILYGIEKGIIRNTGMFMNMPWSEECAAWIRPLADRIALGIDLNISTGAPVLAPDEIPSLVRQDGTFYSSRESRELDRGQNSTHTLKEDLFREFDAQIQRFVALNGRKPDYIHAHAYVTEQIMDVERELSHQYGIPYSSDVWKEIAGFNVMEYRASWYLKPSTLENQQKSSLKQYILENSRELLAREYCVLAGHMGYVDRELMDLSSYSLYRINDLDAVTSPEVICWVMENDVKLITYKDI